MVAEHIFLHQIEPIQLIPYSERSQSFVLLQVENEEPRKTVFIVLRR